MSSQLSRCFLKETWLKKLWSEGDILQAWKITKTNRGNRKNLLGINHMSISKRRLVIYKHYKVYYRKE